jgi:hypothetical protein
MRGKECLVYVQTYSVREKSQHWRWWEVHPAKCLLKSLPAFVRPYVCKNSTTARRTSIKFYFGEFYEKLSSNFNFHLDWTLLTTTLYRSIFFEVMSFYYLNSINQLIFVTVARCVFFEVGTELLWRNSVCCDVKPTSILLNVLALPPSPVYKKATQVSIHELRI